MNTSKKSSDFNKILLNIDYNELNRLKDEKSSFIKLVKCNHHISLHPYHLVNVKKSISEKLNEEICRYNKKLGGIILGSQNVKILDNLAPINNDMCFIHMDIEAEFFVFMPAVDQVHQGVVNKQSNKQIGCLVHKIFNVFLPKPNGEDDWLGLNAQVGQEIQFRITYIDLEGRLPYIRGELLSILSEDSGISTSEELGKSPKRTKKTKYSQLKNETENTKKRKFEDSADESEEPKKKKHKSKKHKIQESAQDDSATKDLNEDDLTDSKQPSKKNKHKKSKENIIEELKEKYMEDVERLAGLITDENLSISKKKKKTKKSKKEKADLDTSLDLDLGDLFTEEFTKKPVSMVMADEMDRGKKQMNNSTSADIQWSDKEIQLPPDSDLEEILKTSEKPKKKGMKRRATVCFDQEETNSQDDFVTPAKKVKRKSK